MGWTVLVTARAFMASGQPARDRLEAAGCTVSNTEPGPLPEDVLIELLQGCDAIIAGSDPFTIKVFDSCPQLKVVSRCGVGYDAVDVEAATERGIIVTTTPGAMTDAVADFTFALMLGIARRIPEGDSLMKSGGWKEYPGTLVWGKTLGIIGFGAIGRGVAIRAAGFNMQILAYDPAFKSSADLPPGLRAIEMVSLEDLLARSDFVSLNAPNLPETRGLMNSTTFAQMKRTAYFINTARGALVDEQALIQALEQGTIAGAAIDVYFHEPVPPDDPIRSAPNCLLAPHNAFNAVEAATQMSILSAENVLAAMRGVRPPGLLNPAVLNSRLRG